MSTPNAQQQAQLRREECRRLSLDYLANRPALAMRAEAIRRGLEREHAADFTIEEVTEAIAYLEGLEHPAVKREASGFGATLSYQVTTAGVRAHERGGL